MRRFVIGTRGSSLALCQARIVQTRLQERLPGASIELATIKAKADQNPDVPLVAMTGEGIFVKELETALLEERVDLAVHSLKDVPLQQPERLCLAAILEREEMRDALVSGPGRVFDELPSGTRIGTSSRRRGSQLLHRRRDVQLMEIRGNVDTRIRKLDDGQYDAIVLAGCGLIRLGMEDRITELLNLEWMLPEPGQGALAVEARADDQKVLQMLQALDHPASRAAVEAERAFLRALGGGCRVPIAAYAECQRDGLSLEGAVIAEDGHAQVRGGLTGSIRHPMALGERLGSELASRGALDLLKRTAV